MWNYDCITRKDFESIKDRIEEFIVSLGGKKAVIDLPYVQKTASVFGPHTIVNFSARPVFEYNKHYFRVSEVCFPEKPFIVIECGTYDELIQNSMEDADPFPYDLTDTQLMNETKESLGIVPYPKG